jgi:hypothetical protein
MMSGISYLIFQMLCEAKRALGYGYPDDENLLMAQDICPVSLSVYIRNQEHTAWRERAFLAVSSLHLHDPCHNHNELLSGGWVPIRPPADRNAQKADVCSLLQRCSVWRLRG